MRKMKRAEKTMAANRHNSVSLKLESLECDFFRDSFSVMFHLYFRKKARYPSRKMAISWMRREK